MRQGRGLTWLRPVDLDKPPRRHLLTLMLLCIATPAWCQGGERPALRELTTDRPDKTESPQTVDRGHFQVELDAATYTHDRADDQRMQSVGVVAFNLKYGVGRDTDLQFVVVPHARLTSTDLASGMRERIAGVGDVTIRLKQNLWGNDTGKTALAVMPFITLPTAKAGLGAEGVEFGVIVPLSVQLSDSIDLGLMTEIDWLRDGEHYHASYIGSATLGFSLTDRLGLYTELYAEHDREWLLTGDTGVTYLVGKDVQLDAGINLGLNGAADDVGLFFGLSKRF